MGVVGIGHPGVTTPLNPSQIPTLPKYSSPTHLLDCISAISMNLLHTPWTFHVEIALFKNYITVPITLLGLFLFTSAVTYIPTIRNLWNRHSEKSKNLDELMEQMQNIWTSAHIEITQDYNDSIRRLLTWLYRNKAGLTEY